MINIQKHIISEAFEQLSKSAKLNESSNSKWTDPLELSDDITLVPGRTYVTPKRYYYSSIKELEMDASDSFRDMINLAKRLGWVNKNQWIVIPKGTFLTYQDSSNPGGAGYINFIVNNNQNDVVSFSTDVSEDLDFIATFKENTTSADWEDTTDVKFDESVKYPNGELVTDIDLDTYLDYYYGEDRDKDNNNYSVREKQRATDYWFKKNDTPVNESKLTESNIKTQYIRKSDLEDYGLDRSDIDDITLTIKDVGDYYSITGDPTNIWNVLHRYDLQWSTVDKINESKLTEAPLTPAEYAAKARARKSKNPLQKINSQLNPDMTITDQLQVYFDELVPSSGKAKTVAGEIVRALMRLLYRDYNDGDLWYTGYGKETCGSEVIYLINELPDFAYDYFSRMSENAMEDAEYTDMLEELAEQAIVYLNENPQLFTQENTDDSRRHDYRKLSDIFSMPTFDYEPDVSYNPPEFNIDDEEIDQLIRDFVRSELSSGEVNRWARDGWTIEGLDKDDYDHAEEEFPMWFADFLEEHRREDEYDDDEDFDESLNKDNQKRGNDIMTKVAEDFELGNLEKMGTNEYEANKNRNKHIKMYRKFANISDSEPITEETLNEYALDKTATYCNREPERIKAEILGQRYSEYEQE